MSSVTSTVPSVQERFVAPPVDPEVIARAVAEGEAFIQNARRVSQLDTGLNETAAAGPPLPPSSNILKDLADPQTQTPRSHSRGPSPSMPRATDGRLRSPRCDSRTAQDSALLKGVFPAYVDMDKDGLLDMIAKLRQELDVAENQGQVKQFLDKERADSKRIKHLEAELNEARAKNTQELSEDREVPNHKKLHRIAYRGLACWAKMLDFEFQIDDDFEQYDADYLSQLAIGNVRRHADLRKQLVESDDRINDLEEEIVEQREENVRKILEQQEQRDRKIERLEAEVKGHNDYVQKTWGALRRHVQRHDKDALEITRLRTKLAEYRESEVADIPGPTARHISQAAGPSTEHVRVPASKKRSLNTEESAAEDNTREDAPLIKRRKTTNTTPTPTSHAVRPSIAGTSTTAPKPATAQGISKAKSKGKAKAKPRAPAIASGSGAGTLAKTTKAKKTAASRPPAAAPVGVKKGERYPTRGNRFSGSYKLR